MSQKSPGAVDKHIGARIRLQRTMIGMSQEKLGENLGITFQQVQKYEKGLNRVGAGRLQSIADVLNVPVSFFFEEQVSPSQALGISSGVQAFLACREGIELAQAFLKIESPAMRRALVELARAAAGSMQSESA